MSARIETMECYPRPVDLFGTVIPAPEPAHDRCGGGYRVPGLIGGWACPCPCHRQPTAIDSGAES